MMWLAIPVEHNINNLILFIIDFEICWYAYLFRFIYVEFNHRAVVI